MRTPRFLQLADGDTLHVYWRCTDSDNQYLLDRQASKEHFLKILGRNKERFGFTLYDYALMDNHQHLLLKITTVKAFSRFLQCVNTSFAKHINKIKGRSGAVVKDRCKVSVLEPGDLHCMLTCQIYFHLNRWVSAKKTPPERYMHCGYRHYALGETNPLLDHSPAWLALGKSDEERCSAFKAKVQARMDEKMSEETRLQLLALEKPPRYLGSKAKVDLKTGKLRTAMREHLAALKARRLIQDIADQIPAGSAREKK